MFPISESTTQSLGSPRTPLWSTILYEKEPEDVAEHHIPTAQAQMPIRWLVADVQVLQLLQLLQQALYWWIGYCQRECILSADSGKHPYTIRIESSSCFCLFWRSGNAYPSAISNISCYPDEIFCKPPLINQNRKRLFWKLFCRRPYMQKKKGFYLVQQHVMQSENYYIHTLAALMWLLSREKSLNGGYSDEIKPLFCL